jgi:hypothetical protein
VIIAVHIVNAASRRCQVYIELLEGKSIVHYVEQENLLRSDAMITPIQKRATSIVQGVW